MKPFTHRTALTGQQKTCNYRISKARVVLENAHGRLKGRWHRIMKRKVMSIENIPTIITAACILHNICEMYGVFQRFMAQKDTSKPQPPSNNARNSNSKRSKEIGTPACKKHITTFTLKLGYK